MQASLRNNQHNNYQQYHQHYVSGSYTLIGADQQQHQQQPYDEDHCAGQQREVPALLSTSIAHHLQSADIEQVQGAQLHTQVQGAAEDDDENQYFAQQHHQSQYHHHHHHYQQQQPLAAHQSSILQPVEVQHYGQQQHYGGCYATTSSLEGQQTATTMGTEAPSNEKQAPPMGPHYGSLYESGEATICGQPSEPTAGLFYQSGPMQETYERQREQQQGYSQAACLEPATYHTLAIVGQTHADQDSSPRVQQQQQQQQQQEAETSPTYGVHSRPVLPPQAPFATTIPCGAYQILEPRDINHPEEVAAQHGSEALVATQVLYYQDDGVQQQQQQQHQHQAEFNPGGQAHESSGTQELYNSHNIPSSSSSNFSSSSDLAESLDSTLTRDEKKAREANIPLSYFEIVNLSIDQFNEHVSKFSFTETQLTLMKDIRRRGKNKVAAQTCRKRKMEQICELQHEVNHLIERKMALRYERSSLECEHERLLKSYEKMYSIIKQHLDQRDQVAATAQQQQRRSGQLQEALEMGTNNSGKLVSHAAQQDIC